MTTKEFIKKAKEMFGNKYDYRVVDNTQSEKPDGQFKDWEDFLGVTEN